VRREKKKRKHQRRDRIRGPHIPSSPKKSVERRSLSGPTTDEQLKIEKGAKRFGDTKAGPSLTFFRQPTSEERKKHGSQRVQKTTYD